MASQDIVGGGGGERGRKLRKRGPKETGKVGKKLIPHLSGKRKKGVKPPSLKRTRKKCLRARRAL